MKVNHKQMYILLRQQLKALKPDTERAKPNEYPENFNQEGWDLTVEKVEQLLEKMKQLRERKGKRLTPQFYKTIYNRAVIGINEIDKLNDTLSLEDETIDFEAECLKLTAEIHELNMKRQNENNKNKQK